MKILNHRGANSVYLNFENGIEVSTIWGACSYSDNHQSDDFENNVPSKSVEVFFTAAPKELKKKLGRKFKDYECSDGGYHFSYVPVSVWLEMIETARRHKV